MGQNWDQFENDKQYFYTIQKQYFYFVWLDVISRNILMQATDKNIRIGKVSIDINSNRYRLRFTYPKGNRHYLKLFRLTEEGWASTLRVAHLINRDIDLGDFDESYCRYSPHHEALRKAKVAEKERTYCLLEIWERYKELSLERVAETSQNYIWKDCDRYLEEAPKELLDLDNAQEFLAHLQKKYAITTIATMFRSCLNPAINMAVNNGFIEANPFTKIKIPKPQKKAVDYITADEVKEIIAAFYSDRYVSKFSNFRHSHYAPYVEILALTGARPEEILALTVEDIKSVDTKTYIEFSKAYSKGILLPYTKNKLIRRFPCNEQLQDILKKQISTTNSRTSLLFTNTNDNGYIDHNNFRSRAWKKVLRCLVEDGKIRKYLKPYALRHSFISRLIHQNWDIKTVATLAGNSPNIIIQNYLGVRDDIELPSL